MEHIRCTAVKSNGERCRITHSLNADGLCWWHAPEHDEARKAWRGKGHQNRKKVRKPGTILSLEDAQKARAWVWQSLTAKELDKDEAKILLSVIDSQEKSLGASELKELRAIAERLTSGSA
jgi:hypothetical protein